MDYIGGIPATNIENNLTDYRFKHLYSKELQQDLLITLLKYPKHSKSLNFLTSDNKLTKLALEKCIIGLEIQENICFGNIPEWKLAWYD